MIGKVVEFVKSPVVGLAELKQAEQQGRSHALARVLMLITSICWAANIVAGKVALQSVSATALAQFRVTAAAAGFGILWFCRVRTPTLRLKATEWGTLSITAIFGITLMVQQDTKPPLPGGDPQSSVLNRVEYGNRS